MIFHIVFAGSIMLTETSAEQEEMFEAGHLVEGWHTRISKKDIFATIIGCLFLTLKRNQFLSFQFQLYKLCKSLELWGFKFGLLIDHSALPSIRKLYILGSLGDSFLIPFFCNAISLLCPRVCQYLSWTISLPSWIGMFLSLMGETGVGCRVQSNFMLASLRMAQSNSCRNKPELLMGSLNSRLLSPATVTATTAIASMAHFHFLPELSFVLE